MNIDTAVYLLYIKSSIHVHIDSEQEEKALESTTKKHVH